MRYNRWLQMGFCAAVISLSSGMQAQQTNDHSGTTVKNVEKSVGSKAKRITKTAEATAKRMAETPAWESLAAAYSYDKASAAGMKAEPAQNANAAQWNLAFTGPDGNPVSGVLLRPKAEGVYPCVLLLHGLTNNKELVVKEFGNALLAKGVAVLALDAPMHGEQKIKGKNMWSEKVLRVAVHEGARDYRCVLDYLETRADVDKSRIGLIGYSLGGIEGPVLGGVDSRISAFVFCIGGDPFLPIARLTANDAQRKELLETSSSLFIGHIAPRPILMINGRKDPLLSIPDVKMMFNAAQEPKQIEWNNGGHEFSEALSAKAVEWMAGKLTAPAK